MTAADAALRRLCALPLSPGTADEAGSAGAVGEAGGAGDPGELPDELFDAVDALIAAHGADDIAEPVARAVHLGWATVEQGTVFLNVAAWSGTDNGASMKHTLDDWLRHCDDPVRLHLALHHEAYPLPTAAEMRVVLTAIGERHPRFREVCRRHLAGRRPGAQQVTSAGGRAPVDRQRSTPGS
ncbi:hypothetical protein ACFWIQ_08705 [Kitasatospora sp. NPDC127059]|uniref:hypothetical protein n=1 Tax=unclassified Kitasatospora TaxID=2633591 RepID=UPI00365EE6D8